jgi:peptidyl-prolyl cis-trans isomerase SurA
MRKIFLLIISLFAFLGMQAQNSNVIDEVIWVIGDDAILLSEVEQTRLQMQMENQHLSGDPYCIIPEQMAVHKLFLHQAKLDSISISDSHVYQRVEVQINFIVNQLGSIEKLEEYFQKTINAYREELRNHFRDQYTVQQMQAELVKDIKITPSDVRTFFNRIPQDSLPYIETTVEVQVVTLEPIPSLEEVDEIKRKLREYTDLVTSGQRDFSSLARSFSADKGTAIKGGEYGFTGKGTLTPEFAAAAFDLNDPKRISRITETEFGFHIIQLIEKRGDRINFRHILLKPFISKEELNAATSKLDSIRNDIVEAKKFTFEEAATWLSHDKDTRNNKGLMVNSNENSDRGGTSRFEMAELPPEMGKVVYGMKVGDISKPFVMINSKGKEVAVIVKLKSRIDGHKASLAEDFQALRTMVEAEKREQVLDKWIAKKQKETYIRINDNWKNCDFERDGWIQNK